MTHSDLKPGNILIDKEGRGKVVDFGVSRVIAGTLLSNGDGCSNPLQANGTVAGATPAYAAPEQFEANRLSQAPSIDIWALGIVLNEAFTGRRHLDDVSQPLQVRRRFSFPLLLSRSLSFLSQNFQNSLSLSLSLYKKNARSTGDLPRRDPAADAARVAEDAAGTGGAAARLLGD